MSEAHTDPQAGDATSSASSVRGGQQRDLPPPWLPGGQIVRVDERGEFFVRRHVHPDQAAPTALLLHGWTATCDLQFLSAYRELAEVCSFVAVDHRGHGRGLRSLRQYELEDVADDAAGIVRELGIDRVIAVGYSMGGPISMHLARRHPDLVDGLIVQATALEWNATWRDRIRWKFLPLMGVFMRSWAHPKVLRKAVERMLADGSELAAHRDWITAEAYRNEPRVMIEAGRALSRHDARSWAGELDVPAASLITTRDRMVKPRKQRQLAKALGAHVAEIDMDHLDGLDVRTGFGAATAGLVEHVAGRRRATDPDGAASGGAEQFSSAGRAAP